MKSKNFRLALFIGIAGLVLLSACSGGAKTTAITPPPQAQEATTGAAPTAYPAPVEQIAPTLPYPYPLPEVNPSLSQSSPYPEPTTVAVPPQVTLPTATSTGLASQPTSTASSDLTATDPSTVQLAAGKPQLVEFFAFWDGTSKAMAPLMHTLETDYAGKINFVYLDIDDPAVSQFQKDLGFKLQPQFFLVNAKGEILKQWSGTVSEADFRAALDAALK
jgi:thiol-disulfide isomerase/thioredoxin